MMAILRIHSHFQSIDPFYLQAWFYVSVSNPLRRVGEFFQTVTQGRREYPKYSP